MLMFAQKTDSIIIKVPFYDAKLPTTDSTNVLWIRIEDLKPGAVLKFENPDIGIASFEIIMSSKLEVFKTGGSSNTLSAQNIFLMDKPLAYGTTTLFVKEIYLKGKLRTANWTYRVRVREY